MQTSTPVVSRGIWHESIESSPLRRRCVPKTPLLEITNDENERSNRREVAEIQRRLSVLPRESSPFIEPYKFKGDQEMKDHLLICTRLYNENKITAKNAWDLHIIECLRHICQRPNENTLQLAGTSLEISAKVFGIKVDDVYSDGLKLANSVSRFDSQPQPSDAEDEAESGNQNQANNSRKKSKKKRRLLTGNKNTICKDPKTLQGRLPKLESVLFSTRNNIEISSTDNLFTNTLKMNNSGYKYTLLSKDKAWPDEIDPVVENVKDPIRKLYPITINSLKNFQICGAFREFEIDDWDVEQEEKLLADRSLASMRQEVVVDDDGIPIAELDGSIHDIFANDDIGEVDEENQIQSVHEEIAPNLRREVVSLQPKMDDGLQKSEYSYNSLITTSSGKIIDQMWAGPIHWKLKFNCRDTPKFSGANLKVNQNKGARKRVIEEVNFEKNGDIDRTQVAKIRKLRPAGDINKITLPVPDYLLEKFCQASNKLLVNPAVCFVPRKFASENEVECDVNSYNYENPHDSLYCSQRKDSDEAQPDAANFDNSDRNDDNIEESAVAGTQNYLPGNLVDAPEVVPMSYVPYARQSKKMDMKKLKAAIWNNLTEASTGAMIETEHKTVVPKNFSQMYKEIPDLLPEKMKTELTSSLAFVALLHLCNEKNLELKQHVDYKDFEIRGPDINDE